MRSNTVPAHPPPTAIRFLDSTLESPLEQARMLEVISNAMAGRARLTAAKRAAGEVVTVRPARIYAHREDRVIVWHLDDGALALYRVVGGLREPDAHVAAHLTWMGCAVS